MKALERRIARLESCVGPGKRMLTPRETAFVACSNRLMESMDSNHARIVRQKVLGGRQAIDEGQRYSKLTINALRHIYRLLSDGTPLALPFSVAAQHLDRGQMTEIDALNGYVARESARFVLAAPYNDALTRIVHGRQHRPETAAE